MDLYIKIENGSPIGNPILLSNLQEIHANFLDNYGSLGYLPCDYLAKPGSRDPYTAFDPVYTINADSSRVATTYIARTMTPAEKQAKIQEGQSNPKEYDSWVFNESACTWEPPVSYPEDGNLYVWNEETTNWVLVTE